LLHCLSSPFPPHPRLIPLHLVLPVLLESYHPCSKVAEDPEDDADRIQLVKEGFVVIVKGRVRDLDLWSVAGKLYVYLPEVCSVDIFPVEERCRDVQGMEMLKDVEQ